MDNLHKSSGSGNNAKPMAAVSEPSTHARCSLVGDEPYLLDSALHVKRYRWTAHNYLKPNNLVLDLGCGTGYGVKMLAKHCSQVVGVDFDPLVLETPNDGYGNIKFFCHDVCATTLPLKLGISKYDVITSMETMEHLEDYFAFLDNIRVMLKPQGVFVVGTPNRSMTYQRYEDRRHMDRSHVQEFTLISLHRVLNLFFSSVDLFFQYIPDYWVDSEQSPNIKELRSSLIRRVVRGVTPPYLTRVYRRLATALHPKRPENAVSLPKRYWLEEVVIDPVGEAENRRYDAFALIAVCSNSRERGEGNCPPTPYRPAD